MDHNFFSLICSIIVTVAVLVITGYAIPTLRQRIGEDRLQEIKQLVVLAVRYAEQIYTPEQWAEKKKAVQAYIYERAIAAGLSEQDIDVLIEACVNEIKKG